MSVTFLLLPGAGGAGWIWSHVVPRLEAAGHHAIAIDLPAADATAGLEAYADIAVRAAAGASNVVLVAYSLGGFTAPLVAERIAIERLVFVNAMIPKPQETAGEWGKNLNSREARTAAAKVGGYSEEFELATYFFHDISAELATELTKHEADEASIVFRTPCPFRAWPTVPTHVVIGKGDRLFPAPFQERVARERLGDALTSVDHVPGGHLAALAEPEAVASTLLTLATSRR